MTLNFSAVLGDGISAGRGLSATQGYGPKEKNLALPFLLETPRYFWCGKLLLLPKKTLHLFQSNQISVIWNINSNLGHFPPKTQ